MPDKTNSEIDIINKTIEDSIKWPFPEKNPARLEGALAHDDKFFIFHPDSKSTVIGYDSFKKTIENVFMDPELKPQITDIKDMRINISQLGDCAWFSCYLDDVGEYKGKKWEWIDCRWTGVLEKRDGKWQIVQMHFSLPTDK